MLKTETAKERTYGECIVAELRSICLIDGRFVATLRICNKPEPLPREDAIAYYTEKLRKIWGGTLKMKNISDRDLKKLNALKDAAIQALESMKEKLEELADRAEEHYEGKSENWQESDNGIFYNEWVEAMRDKAGEVENNIDEINTLDFEDIQEPPRA